MAVHAEAHAEAEFRVVLEQRVRPRRPAPVAVRRERRGRQVAAVNRRAARGVRHEGAVAEELREQLDVRRFAAPGARPRVLEQRLEELRRLVVDLRQIDARGVGQVEKERVVVALGVAERRLRVHVDRLVPGVRPILGRADVHAQVAARAVLRRHLNRVRPPLELEPFVGHGLERRRRAGERAVVVHLGADGRMRTHQHALIALDADARVPHRDLEREVPLLPLRRADRPRAVHRKRAHRQQIALPGQEHGRHPLDEVGRQRGHQRRTARASR